MKALWIVLLYGLLMVVRLDAFAEDDTASDVDTEMSNEEEEEDEESGSGATEIEGIAYTNVHLAEAQK